MTRFNRTLSLLGALLLGSTSLAGSARAAEHDGQQLYPLLSYRTGPYASSGIPQWAGRRDYITYVNDHGGVDGVKIFVQECETAYTLERGFECYERYKNGYDGAPLAILVGTSSGFDVAASEKLRADKSRSPLPAAAVKTRPTAPSSLTNSRSCSTTGPRHRSWSTTSPSRWAATTS
jgi:branched-chain amino acid transport system substrate-binding protein